MLQLSDFEVIKLVITIVIAVSYFDNINKNVSISHYLK